MLKNSLSFLILLFSCSAFSQSGKPFDNNDPRVNTAEAQWLNEHAATPGFDFRDKTIGFIMVTPALMGIGKDYHPNSKKVLFTHSADEYLLKVIVLDSTEQVQTSGYDALLLLSGKKHPRKFRNSNKAEALEVASNLYPLIPEEAGTDNSNQLSLANATFFNRLYEREKYLEHFDFVQKKVLILGVDYSNGPPKFISINNYVQHVKSKLYQWASYDPDYAFVLTPEQKEKSGGDDVIISIFSTKKGLDLNYLLQFLEQK